MLCHSLGIEIPADYEGEFPASFYDPSYLMSDPPRKAAGAVETAAEAKPQADDLDEEDEALLMERLKSLGYVE